ncbi:MAG: hypothetical protein ACT4PL_00390 [Phycisphaerales bacterium]
MNPPGVLVLVAAFVLMDVVILGVVFSVATGAIRTLAASFPPRAVAADAVFKRGQSISLGLMNYGWSFDISVDAACLHLCPKRFWRALGATPISIPWEHIELKNPGSRWRPASARVGKTDLSAPAWALALARTDGGPGSPPPSP